MCLLNGSGVDLPTKGRPSVTYRRCGLGITFCETERDGQRIVKRMRGPDFDYRLAPSWLGHAGVHVGRNGRACRVGCDSCLRSGTSDRVTGGIYGS